MYPSILKLRLLVIPALFAACTARSAEVGKAGGFFQVVFFVQLPQYRYPAGRWYGKAFPSRDTYLNRCGIEAQFWALSQRLPDERAAALARRDLFGAGPSLGEVLRTWFAQVFEPHVPWEFEPAQHLRDAAVAAKIWKY